MVPATDMNAFARPTRRGANVDERRSADVDSAEVGSHKVRCGK